MYNPENQYINNIDNNQNDKLPESIGFSAEDVVVNYFNTFPGMSARMSTHDEDSGLKQIRAGAQIDAVIYEDDVAVLCAQITTARDPRVQKEKLLQLMERPFVKLSESRPKDPAVPKVLIGLDPDAVSNFLEDNDFSRHPEICSKILKDTLTGLNFDLSKTKNPEEQQRIKKLITTLSGKNTLN
jgi:hypothetical protein